MNAGLKNGLILGLISVILSLVLYLINPKLLFNGWYMLLAFILPFVFMAKACIEARNDNDGYISFGGAFLAAWITMMVSMVLGMIWNYVLHAFIDPSLSQLQLEWVGEMMESWGFMDMEDYVDMAESQGSQDPTNPLNMLLGIFCGGLFMTIPAAIYGLIFKRENNNLVA